MASITSQNLPVGSRRLSAEKRAQQAPVGPAAGQSGVRLQYAGGPNATRPGGEQRHAALDFSRKSAQQVTTEDAQIGGGPEAQYRRKTGMNARSRKPLTLAELETAPAFRAISEATGPFTKHVADIQQDALEDAKRRTPSKQRGPPPGDSFLSAVLQEDKQAHSRQPSDFAAARFGDSGHNSGNGINRSHTQQFVSASRQKPNHRTASGSRTVRHAASGSLVGDRGGGISTRGRAAKSTTHAGPQTFRTEGWSDPLMQAGTGTGAGTGGGVDGAPATPGSAAAAAGQGSGRRGPRRGSIQVARSLARRRQARMELQGLQSKNNFVNSFWYGNKALGGAGSGVVRGKAGGKGRPPHGRGSEGSTVDSVRALVVPRSTESKGGATRGNEGTSTTAAGVQSWTGTDQEGVVRRAGAGAGAGAAVGAKGGMYTQQSLTEQQLHAIIKEHDQATPGRRARAAARRKADAEAGQSRRGTAAGGMPSRRQSSRLGFDREGGEGDASSSGDPQSLGNPAEVSLRAQAALARDAEPDEGLSGCWARCTRGCREWYAAYQTRRGVAAQDVVLTGRAREAVEALQLSRSQLRVLHGKFMDLDSGMDGRIHIGTFLEEWLDMDRTPVTDALYTALVENTSGRTMSFNDFVLLVCVVSLMTELDLLRLIFGCFDSDSSGGLDEEETVRMLIMVQPNQQPLFGGNFRVALKEFDANQDGKISFDEFITMHRRFPQLLYPALHFQARVQERSLGVTAWKDLARRTVTLQQAARKDGTVVGAAGKPSSRGIGVAQASSRRQVGAAAAKYGQTREDRSDVLLAAGEAQALPTTAAAASGRMRGGSRRGR